MNAWRIPRILDEPETESCVHVNARPGKEVTIPERKIDRVCESVR
jgi:hypothetical protein